MSTSGWISVYLAAQAIAGFGWWIAIWMSPSAKQLFWAADTSRSTLAAFAVADLLAFVGASAVAAWLVRVEHGWAIRGLWLVVGATGYATLYCVGSTVATGEASLAAFVMLIACACTTAAACTYRDEQCR